MARSGDVIEHPVSGETMVFLQTAEDTDGELLQVDLFVRSGGGVSAAHIHPEQAERFVVKRGQMTLQIGDEVQVLESGEEIVIEAGTPHVWWNSGDGELNTLLELRPAGRFEDMVSSFFGLAKAGHVNDAGLPGMLQTAVTLREYEDTIVLSELAPVTQKVIVPVLAAVGRVLGLRPNYPYPRSARVNSGMEIWRRDRVLAGR